MPDPVIYTNDLETGLAHEQPELCKPVPRVISRSKLLTALFIAIPMIMMFILLLYFEYGIQTIYFRGYPYDFSEFRQFFTPPILLVSSITFVTGTISLTSLYFGLYYIVGVCSYIYSAIAYWLIFNTLIVSFCSWDYLRHDVIGYIFMWATIGSSLWLFSSAVMDAYMRDAN